jgi:gonadotropin-releasing hormone receptor
MQHSTSKCIDNARSFLLNMRTLQMVVFHVESHPNITWYLQCVTYNVFPTYAHELAYLLFSMIMMYALPLTVIIFSYAAILTEICRRTRNPYGGE